MACVETRSLDGSKRGTAPRARGGVRAPAAVLALFVAGCAAVEPAPLAPPAVDRTWQPPVPMAALQAPADAWRAPDDLRPDAGTVYDLPALIDVALRDNPDTRATWAAAHRAAAEYGRALAPYYPTLGVDAALTPVSRFQEATAGSPLTIHLHAADPGVVLTWTLLDFGRRAQSAEHARQQLLAANLRFNRRLQDVVFRVQQAYYRLDAAQGLARAAERNLELAATVRAAAEQRLAVGLATRPDLLLARQTEARARYELEEARVAVQDAHAELALALGRPADRPLAIEPLADQPPPALDGAVEALITDALRNRPDLAARAAVLRAADADVARARAAFLPVLEFRGRYGQQIWDYQAGSTSGLRANEPTYDTLFGVRWDLFAGFERLNALRAAEAGAAAAQAELASAQLDATAETWRAWHDYRAAARKLEFATALLAASQDACDGTLESYRAGLSDIVELLTAERDLATARYTLVLSKAELLITAARIAWAAGAVRR